MARFTVANKTENIEHREDDKKRWRTGGSGSLHRHLQEHEGRLKQGEKRLEAFLCLAH